MAQVIVNKSNKRKCVNFHSVDDLISLPTSKRLKPNIFSLLEDFCFECPLVGGMILEKIDNQSLISCKKVNRQMHVFLENEIWIRTIRDHLQNFQEFQEFQDQWKIIIKKTPAKILKELATVILNFFSIHPQNYGYQWAPIHIAAQQGSLKLFKYILDKTGDAYSTRKDGWTTLHMAVDGGNFEVCQFLVDNMANKNPGSLSNLTPLHIAAMFGHLRICKLIIENVENKNPADSKGQTPLHEAARFNYFKICKLMIKNISNKNPADDFGITPLHYAAEGGYFNVCKLIMKQNIDNKNPGNLNGITPLHKAAKESHMKICQLFDMKLFCANYESSYLRFEGTWVAIQTLFD